MNSEEYDSCRYQTLQSNESLTISIDQFTNCLDELLRDSVGNVIIINPFEYNYKYYPDLDKTFDNSVRKPTRYVFKNGRLFELNSDSNYSFLNND